LAPTLQKLAKVICPDCPPVREAHAMFVASLWPYLAYAVLPFVFVALAVLGVLRLVGARHDRP
jgi:hypothetical protein